jgi:hypothetical protein
MALKLHSKITFAKEIEELVKTNEFTYLEAISHYMEKTQMEPDKVKKLMSPALKDKLKQESIKYNRPPFRGQKVNPLNFDE